MALFAEVARQVAQVAADAAAKTTVCKGVAVTDSDGHVQVQIGGQVWTSTDPAGAVRTGDQVMLAVNGNTAQVLGVILPPATVAAAPGAVSGSTGTAYGCDTITVTTTYNKADLDASFAHIVDITGDLAGFINSLDDRVTALTTANNALRTTVVAMYTALQRHGIIAT